MSNYIYYQVFTNVGTPKQPQWWKVYDFLTENDAAIVGQNNDLRLVRLKRLFNHKSHKFTEMRNSKAMVVKVFSKEPVRYMDWMPQLKARINKQVIDYYVEPPKIHLEES